MGESGGVLTVRQDKQATGKPIYNLDIICSNPRDGGNAALAERYEDPRGGSAPGRRLDHPQVSRKQRQLILYLFRNPDQTDHPAIYLELNWPSQTVTRIGKGLIRKGLIKKVSSDPPSYAPTSKCRDIIDIFRGRGY